MLGPFELYIEMVTATAVKIVYTYAVPARFQFQGPAFFPHPMIAVVIYDQTVVNIQFTSLVAMGLEGV